MLLVTAGFKWLASATLFATILACPDHLNNDPSHTERPISKRADNTSSPAWAYEASYNWHTIDNSYSLCQNGTQQSPIALSLSQGLSHNHIPTFNYPRNTTGNFYNWGYGPAFTVAHNGDWTTHPSVIYDNETVYLKGWHIHAPADHSVGGVRSKAELHLVHANASGYDVAVFAIRLDPGNADAPFFAQMPAYYPFTDTASQSAVSIDLESALEAVLHFNEFWTYRGSLTSPPCTEGIRFFVARQILWTGVVQMQEILGVSSFSARAEQEVWLHRINE